MPARGFPPELSPPTDSREPDRAMPHTPPVRALVIDFDGTICPNDVSEEILEAFAPRAWWDIDLAFQRGEIGSRECLVRQGRIARSEDQVRLRLDAQLGLKRRLHVDLAQHAESFGRELTANLLDRVAERRCGRFAQRVASGEHLHSSSSRRRRALSARARCIQTPRGSR